MSLVEWRILAMKSDIIKKESLSDLSSKNLPQNEQRIEIVRTREMKRVQRTITDTQLHTDDIDY